MPALPVRPLRRAPSSDSAPASEPAGTGRVRSQPGSHVALVVQRRRAGGLERGKEAAVGFGLVRQRLAGGERRLLLRPSGGPSRRVQGGAAGVALAGSASVPSPCEEEPQPARATARRAAAPTASARAGAIAAARGRRGGRRLATGFLSRARRGRSYARGGPRASAPASPHPVRAAAPAACSSRGRPAAAPRKAGNPSRGGAFRAVGGWRDGRGGRKCANRVALWGEVGYVRPQRAGVEGLLPLLHLGSVINLKSPQWPPSVAPSTIRSTRRTASRFRLATAPRWPTASCWRCRST